MLIYSYFREKLEKISKKLLQYFSNRIIIPIGNNLFISKRIDKALLIYQQRIKEKEKEKRGFELLLNDRQTVLKQMEIIIKRLVTIEKIVLSQK